MQAHESLGVTALSPPSSGPTTSSKLGCRLWHKGAHARFSAVASCAGSSWQSFRDLQCPVARFALVQTSQIHQEERNISFQASRSGSFGRGLSHTKVSRGRHQAGCKPLQTSDGSQSKSAPHALIQQVGSRASHQMRRPHPWQQIQTCTPVKSFQKLRLTGLRRLLRWGNTRCLEANASRNSSLKW